MQQHYRIPCVVAINEFVSDTAAEVALVESRMAQKDVQAVRARHWAEGGKGAVDLARIVVDLCEQKPNLQFVYEDQDTLWEKIEKISTKVYRAARVVAEPKVHEQIDRLQEEGYGHYPVCVAKTQYSFSTDAHLRGAPADHVINVREVRLSAGAEFVVMICGDMMTMPGLPKAPAAQKIDIDEHGKVAGLF